MKKPLKIILFTSFILVTALALYFFVVYPLTWSSRERNESVRILDAAQTTDDLKQAVGPLGIFLSFPDGSWMVPGWPFVTAIRTREAFSPPP